MILKVGLTGGMASGKSTVAHTLAECGLPVLDADRIVHALYTPEGEGTALVREAFGEAVLDRTGAVDRRALATTVFGNHERVHKLNSLIHPLVFQKQEAWFASLVSSQDRVGVVEATLLLETGGRRRYDIIVTVSAPEAKRVDWALARSPQMSRDEALGRILAQWSDEKREILSDIVIRNEGDRDALIAKARALAAQIQGEVLRKSQPV